MHPMAAVWRMAQFHCTQHTPQCVSVFVYQVVAKGTTDDKWNKRFFRLTDAFLLYYRNPEAKAPAGWCVLLFHPHTWSAALACFELA